MTQISKAELLASTGKTLGRSNWFTLDQHRIDQFAAVTEDRQFIHTDPLRAQNSPFGGTIAHGFLTLSMLSAMMLDGCPAFANCRMGVNYGFDKVRFITPVAAGSRVRAHFTLRRVTELRPNELQTTTEITVEIDGQDRPALVAQWLGRFYFGDSG